MGLCRPAMFHIAHVTQSLSGLAVSAGASLKYYSGQPHSLRQIILGQTWFKNYFNKKVLSQFLFNKLYFLFATIQIHYNDSSLQNFCFDSHHNGSALEFSYIIL